MFSLVPAYKCRSMIWWNRRNISNSRYIDSQTFLWHKTSKGQLLSSLYHEMVWRPKVIIWEEQFWISQKKQFLDVNQLRVASSQARDMTNSGHSIIYCSKQRHHRLFKFYKIITLSALQGLNSKKCSCNNIQTLVKFYT